MSDEPITIDSIRRLDVRPGDTLVLTVPEHTTTQQAHWIREQWIAAFPDARAIVLHAGMEVTVVGEVDA